MSMLLLLNLLFNETFSCLKTLQLHPCLLQGTDTGATDTEKRGNDYIAFLLSLSTSICLFHTSSPPHRYTPSVSFIIDVSHIERRLNANECPQITSYNSHPELARLAASDTRKWRHWSARDPWASWELGNLQEEHQASGPRTRRSSLRPRRLSSPEGNRTS